VSNFLAPAAVTATLRRILGPAVSADVPGATITMVRPDVRTVRKSGPRVNIFLYHVNSVATQRNTPLTARGPDAGPEWRSMAVTLSYILSFYGDEAQLEPQRAMGSVLSTLQRSPVFTPEMIHATEIDPAYPYLAQSDLGSEPQALKVELSPLTADDMTKLWASMFQTPYTLSVVYEVSTVFIGGH
jgi:hypothetical protein